MFNAHKCRSFQLTLFPECAFHGLQHLNCEYVQQIEAQSRASKMNKQRLLIKRTIHIVHEESQPNNHEDLLSCAHTLLKAITSTLNACGQH